MENEIIPRGGKPNPAFTYLASLPSETSRRTMADALKVIARKLGGDLFTFNWVSLRYEHLVMLQTWLAESRKPATVRRYMAAVKGTLKAAWSMGDMTAEEYQRAVSMKPIRGKSMTGRMLEAEEVQALLENCNLGGPNRGIRDAAIICLLVGCGLRRTEITTLMLSDYDPPSGRLTVHGKGRKDRFAYPTHGVHDAMAEWLGIRGNEPGPLFYVVVKSDDILRRKMSSISIYVMLSERREAAGLAPFGPHDLRRTFISDMLALTDLATASKLAGHEDPITTTRYDKRPERVVQEAAGLLKIPYRKRGEL